MELGKRIKEKRKAERLSAQDLAIKLGLKKENIYKWERGAKPSDPGEYSKIKDWLDPMDEASVTEITDPQKLEQDKSQGFGQVLTGQVHLTVGDYIALLKAQNERLASIIETNLTAIHANLADLKTSVKESQATLEGQVFSSLAHHRTILKVLERQDKVAVGTYLGDANKEQAAIENLGTSTGKQAAAHT